MSVLTIYPEHQPEQSTRYTDYESIQAHLHSLGVQFEQWETEHPLEHDTDQNEVLNIYRDPIEVLKQQYHFQSIDVIRVHPDQPEKEVIRKKFLGEHTHDDFEIRFFIEGSGLFYLHIANKVYAVLCEKGDLISVPANTLHWFDMGENPCFSCIRFFTTPYGWVANFTDDPISESFPTLDDLVADVS